MHPDLDMAYFLEDEIVGRSTWREGEVDAERWDQTHSPTAYSSLFQAGNGFRAIGEKSADYLFWRSAHRRIARYLPETRFIITLRNPIDRAWSHYWNEVGKGRETLSFEEALEAEEERCLRSAWARDHLSYVARGYYDQSLEAFYRHIPASRVLVLTIEQCRANPAEKLNEIYNFIGVDTTVGYDLEGTRHNVNWTTVPRSAVGSPGIRAIERIYTRIVTKVADIVSRDIDKKRALSKDLGSIFRKPAAKIAMCEKSRRYLEKLYERHIEALETLLNCRFPEWR